MEFSITIYNVDQNNGRKFKSVKYGKSRFGKTFNSGLLYAGLTVGEDFLAGTTALALAKHYKMLDENGKETNLWDAYTVEYTDESNKIGAHLKIKNGYRKIDGTKFTAEDEAAFSKKIADLNFRMQGIYNLDDRSAIQQYSFGALIIMYRKWIAPSLRRRYGKTMYNLRTQKFEEGYYRTLWNLLTQSHDLVKEEASEEESEVFVRRIIDDIQAFINGVKVNYDNLTEYEKGNIKRACWELGIILGLFAATTALQLIPPDDDDDDPMPWVVQMTLLNLFRTRTELASQAPTPMLIQEGMKILKSPFAAIGPLQACLNTFKLMWIPNYFQEVKHGKYKGHSEAYKYFRELPIVSIFDRLENLADPSGQINYYKSGQNF